MPFGDFCLGAQCRINFLEITNDWRQDSHCFCNFVHLRNINPITRCFKLFVTMKKKEKKVVVVTGPTAVGKTTLAVNLADRFHGEVISVDSRQVYRGLNIGSGKDLAEYARGSKEIRHHLIDIVDPSEEYSLMNFLRDAVDAIVKIEAAGTLPILAGGTPLYLKALLTNYEMPGGPPVPQTRRRLEAKSTSDLKRIARRLSSDVKPEPSQQSNRPRLIRSIEKTLNPNTVVYRTRLDLRPLVLGVYLTREKVRARIAARLDERLEEGMIEEVDELRRNGLSWERLDRFGLEYRYISRYLKGDLTYDEMKESLLSKIRKFAKSQDAWFRNFERSGIPIHWLDGGNLDEASRLMDAFIADKPLPNPRVRLSEIFYGPRSS